MANKALLHMQTARARLLMKQAFFGSIALHLQLVEDPNIPTLATNGVYLKYNPSYVLTLGMDILPAAIAHEALHIVFMHLTRRKERDPTMWNAAGDFAINDCLVMQGFKLGDGWLHDTKFRGWSTDKIYLDLMQHQKSAKKKSCGGMHYPSCGHNHEQSPSSGKKGQQPDNGDGEDATGMSERELEDHVKELIAAVASATKLIGSVPAELKELVNSILYPKTDWRDALRQFVEESCRDNYSWDRPNPRFVQHGFYLPVLQNRKTRPFVIALDTSGSISAEEAARYVGETSDILAALNPEWIDLVQCDASIAHTERYEPQDLPIVGFEIHGRGGTDFRPVFEWIEAEEIEPSGVIYMTDLYIGDNGIPPDPGIPVVWITKTQDPRTMPYGEVIVLND